LLDIENTSTKNGNPVDKLNVNRAFILMGNLIKYFLLIFL